MIKLPLLLLGLLSTAAIHANQRNDIPGCYEYAKIDRQTERQQQSRELVVAIDATFAPDVPLKKQVHEKVHRFIKPGDSVNVVSFSAYVGNNYTQVLFSGRLDNDIAERDQISKKALKKFDSCMQKQRAFVKKSLDQAIKSSFKPDGVEVPKTELITNLSQVIAPMLASSSAQSKRLLLVSDMVENSTATSFYSKNQLRVIEPKQELAKVESAGLTANFSQSDIYIIGAGWLPTESKGFRGSDVMLPLKEFWQLYFNASQAQLKGFGQPALIEDLI
ncbi:hypothetical protein [Motilimonas sp. KMU-193]|uniref:hypothetical protein n=1 Tax=Motilimonas sp. KMU-193 TaxID=3388668 RepID=UPI00396B0057